jgi:hypothetical protein
VEVAVGEIAVDVQIAERILLVERLALELQVERRANQAVRALGADQPAVIPNGAKPRRCTRKNAGFRLGSFQSLTKIARHRRPDALVRVQSAATLVESALSN